MTSTKKVRTRFAPSPTGYVHIGTIRTALYAFLFARKNGGDFLLRIEDTDQSREVEGAVENLLRTLSAVHIHHDEGPKLADDGTIYQVGEYGPYYQSERLDIYRRYIDQLILQGHAYYSFRTPEELEVIRKDLEKHHRPLKQADLAENYTIDEVNTKITQGVPYVVRLKTPTEGELVFHDTVKGDVRFRYADIDDQVILKSDGFPTYHLASVVDDHLMEITHVIRGDEWLASVPKHMYLYECFGWEAPVFAHLPLILNPDKTKLSKRQGDVAVEDYLSKGYLPETLVNFVALLGWNPGEGSTEEFFTLEELIDAFSLEKVHSAGAVFDTKKLNWMSGKYLRERIDIETFLTYIENDLKEYAQKSPCGIAVLEDRNKLLYFAQLIRDRVDTLTQVSQWFEENQWLDSPAAYEQSALQWKKSTLEDALIKLSEVKNLIISWPDDVFINVERIEMNLKQWIADRGYGVGDVLWPLRYALSGQEKSPNPFELLYILGQEESVQRIQQSLDKK